MLTLNAGATGDKLAGKQDVGTDVVYEINGDDVQTSPTDTYGSLAQGALSTTATALIGPATGHSYIVDDMKFTNTGTGTRTVTLYKTKNSTTYDATTQWATIVLLGGESVEWVGGTAWTVYDSSGKPRLAAVKAPPDPNAQSYTPGGFTVLTGTYVILANHLQLVSTQRVVVQGTGRVRVI